MNSPEFAADAPARVTLGCSCARRCRRWHFIRGVVVVDGPEWRLASQMGELRPRGQPSGGQRAGGRVGFGWDGTGRDGTCGKGREESGYGLGRRNLQ
jgi:hypothetical protein